MSGGLAAGVDVGTTFAKGVVVEPDGSCARWAHAPIPSRSRGADGLDADAVVEAIRSTADQLWPFDALCVAGFVNSHLLVGEGGEALTPALMWGDNRASAYTSARWKASSAVARAAYWAAKRPDEFAQARWLMLPRDYAVMRLCGRACTDSTSWPDLVQGDRIAADLPPAVRERLPPLLEPGTVAGEFRGVPLVVGCMDSLAAVLGIGPTPPGTAIDVGGTSETVGVISLREEHRPAVRGTLRLPDGWWHAGPTQAGGRALSWAAELLAGCEHERLIEMAESATRPTNVTFLPYLEGERAPLWDPDAQAAFLGVRAAHGPAELACAVLEGVAFSVRHVLEGSTPDGEEVRRMVIAGRPSAVPLWNQIKADVLGLSSFVPDEPETGARGAAMLARAALTGEPLAQVRAELALRGRVIEPEPGRVRAYERLYRDYVRVWPAIRAAMRRDEPEPDQRGGSE